MKLPAGWDDECVDALLILFAAKMEICFFFFFFRTGGMSRSSHNWQQVSDARLITSMPRKIPNYGNSLVAPNTIPAEHITPPWKEVLDW